MQAAGNPLECTVVIRPESAGLFSLDGISTLETMVLIVITIYNYSSKCYLKKTLLIIWHNFFHFEKRFSSSLHVCVFFSKVGYTVSVSHESRFI